MNKKIAARLLLVAFAVSLAAPMMACETPAPTPRPVPEVPQAP